MNSLQKKEFYSSLLTLALPIVIQNLITNAVSSVDVLMLNNVGEQALSAVSLAQQVQFLINGFFFGIGSAVVILVAQYWGKKDMVSIQAIMGIAFKISFVVTAVCAIGAIFFPRLIMSIFTDDTVLIEIGVQYLRMVGISYVLLSISQVYEYTMRSIERAKLTTVLASTALVLNVVLNACFIYGFFFFPKLGVLGVAIATVIARSIEVLLCFLDAVRSKVLDYKFNVFFGKNTALTIDFIKYAIPALLNDMVWTVAFSTYSIIFGHLGSYVVSASAIATTIRNLLTTVAFGVASAGNVIIGKTIGENKMQDAKQQGDTICHITLGVAVVTGLIVLLTRPIVFKFYGGSLSEEGLNLLNYMLIISSYYVVGQIMNTLIIAGILRAGGNTKFGLICDTIDMWLVAVPINFLCAFVLKLPIKPLYFIMCLDEFYKIPFVYRYYKKYNWLCNITHDYDGN